MKREDCYIRKCFDRTYDDLCLTNTVEGNDKIEIKPGDSMAMVTEMVIGTIKELCDSLSIDPSCLARDCDDAGDIHIKTLVARLIELECERSDASIGLTAEVTCLLSSNLQLTRSVAKSCYNVTVSSGNRYMITYDHSAVVPEGGNRLDSVEILGLAGSKSVFDGRQKTGSFTVGAESMPLMLSSVLRYTDGDEIVRVEDTIALGTESKNIEHNPYVTKINSSVRTEKTTQKDFNETAAKVICNLQTKLEQILDLQAVGVDGQNLKGLHAIITYALELAKENRRRLDALMEEPAPLVECSTGCEAIETEAPLGEVLIDAQKRICALESDNRYLRTEIEFIKQKLTECCSNASGFTSGLSLSGASGSGSIVTSGGIIITSGGGGGGCRTGNCPK